MRADLHELGKGKIVGSKNVEYLERSDRRIPYPFLLRSILSLLSFCQMIASTCSLSSSTVLSNIEIALDKLSIFYSVGELVLMTQVSTNKYQGMNVCFKFK